MHIFFNLILAWFNHMFWAGMKFIVNPHKIQGDLAKLSFTPGGGAATILAALTEWELNFKLKVEETTNNDDAGWHSSIPGTAGWTATAKSIYVEGDASQATIEGFIGPGGTVYGAGLPSFTFYPEKTAAGSGENSWVGSGYITDWKLTGKNGSAFAMDITIEGTGALVKTAQ